LEIKKDILWRVYLCFIGIALSGLLVLGKAIYIQRVEGKYWKNMGDSLHLRYQPLNAERGTIFSEDGNMLSTSIPIFDVYIDFGAEGLREKNGKRFYDNLDSLSNALSTLFNDKSPFEYQAALKTGFVNKARYFSLKKKISFSQFKELREFPLVRLGRNKSGFIFEPRDKRINPYVLLANRTIGLSRLDSTKNVGLERTYDSLLKGTTGQRLMRYAAGVYLPVEGAELDPVNGKDIVTTLDTYIQDVAEQALMNMLVGNNSKHGTVIVMETETGKIKAIANLGQQPDGTFTEDLNYGIGKRTEPGSIFKLVTLLCLLDDKYVTDNSIVDCEGGSKSFYGLRIKDSHLGLGSITVKDAFARSSNVAFAKLAEQYYHHQPKRFTDHLHRFRLDTLTGVEVTANSGHPVIYKPSSKYWHPANIPYMAHGYSELVTPLNMLVLYNAVANNGRMMKPYLVNSIQDYGVTVKTFQPEVLVEKIVSDEAVKQAQACLKAVVDSPFGTGHAILYDTSYSIAGKSGTAVTALDNRGYVNGRKIYQSSFIGYFPADRPKYTMAVVIQNSSNSKQYYGATVAGKVFKEISDKIFSHCVIDENRTSPSIVLDSASCQMIGLKSELSDIMNFFKMPRRDSASVDNWSVMTVNNRKAIVKNLSNAANVKSVTPDVTGMGLKDALYMLENKGFRTSVIGRGRVVSQSLAPGTAYSKGQKISLLLN
jgi:cell division protein FtsI (penicillin-binding protein 3)